MITVSECAAFAGLASNELVLGAVPAAKHRLLLSAYLFNLHRGPGAVRDMIVADLRCFLDLGVTGRAADLLIVLRMFLSDYPRARLACEDDRKLAAGEAHAPSREARSRGLDGVEDRHEGVVISLRGAGRLGRAAARGPTNVAAARREAPVVARLGSRLFYLRNDR